MVAKYVINKGTRKLHAVTCRTVKDSVGYSAGSDLNTLLEETDSKISCCKVCLKDDEKAQAVVEAHNRKIKKS